MIRPYRLSIHDLFSQQPLARSAVPELMCDIADNAADDTTCSNEFYFNWTVGPGQYWNLMLYAIINFLFTIMSVTLNWPCGLFAVKK